MLLTIPFSRMRRYKGSPYDDLSEIDNESARMERQKEEENKNRLKQLEKVKQQEQKEEENIKIIAEKHRLRQLEKAKQQERKQKEEEKEKAEEQAKLKRIQDEKRKVKEQEEIRHKKEEKQKADKKQTELKEEKRKQKQFDNIIIPKNPKTTFVQAEREEQNKIKFIGYEPSIQFEQREPFNYPMVFMPKSRSVIKFPRKGKQGLKGYTEDLFKQQILKYFKSTFKVFDDRFVLYKSNQNPFEPDFTLVDENNGINLFIDIEIDEPYDGISRQPIHYVGFDNQRNSFFKNRGWIIIRFAEYQIFKETLSCCKFIAEVVKSVNQNFVISDKLSKINDIVPIQQWTKEQAVAWSNDRYREKYLGTDKFTKKEHETILENLNETEVGKEAEEYVTEEQTDTTEFKRSLINRAIQYNNFISCKVSTNYTVIKPLRIENTTITGFCYLKNVETKYEINQIIDLILREKPFVFRMNGEIGVAEIKSFLMRYIGSKNPVRIKYTKSAWPELVVDEETGEVYLTNAERKKSLRTITGFDLVSKLISPEKIKQFNMNDNDHVAGFCHLRNDLRNFRFDRINELEILNI